MSLGTIAFTRVNNLLESGGVGRIEECVLTFDGNTEGRDAAKFQGVDMFYKVSDKILTADEVGRSTAVVVEPNGGETVLTAEQLFTIDGSAYGLPAGLFTVLSDNPHGPIAVFGKACDEGGLYAPSDGTYFISHPEYGHRLRKLSFKTIVPIDPKFLPGVCLPVVEFTTEPTEDGAPLTAEEAAIVQNLYDGGSLFIGKLISQGLIITTPFCLVTMRENGGAYGTTVSGVNYYIRRYNPDAVWALKMETT